MRTLAVSVLLAVAAFAAPQSVTLQLKFPVGRVERVTSANSMTMDANGLAFQNNVSSSMLMRVLSSDATGSAVSLTYEKLDVTTSAGGQTVPSPMSDQFASIKGKAVTLHFDPAGVLQHVEGFDKLKPATGDDSTGFTKQFTDAFYSDKAVRDMWSMSFGNVPDHAVKVGDTWNASLTVGSGPVQISLDMTMTLLGVITENGHSIARVGIGGTGKMALGNLPEGAESKIKVEKFVLGGGFRFDLDRGWTTSETFSAEIRATVDSPNGQVPLGMKVEATSKVAAVAT